MKKIIALVLLAVAMINTGCVKTKKEVEEVGKPNGIEVNILAISSAEKDANILRDQLGKAGFDVKLNIQPDLSGFTAQQKAGNYDIALSGWTTVTGNPDYAVRSIFKTGGDYNKTFVADKEIDALIDKASTETAEKFKGTYSEFEKKLVDENAYIIPLYSSVKSQAFNKNILKEGTVRLSKARASAWETIDFVDESKRATDPLVLTQTLGTLTSLDPIKGNDGSINTLNTNMYVRLVNLTDDDKITSKGSLSYNNVIADGSKEYYFVLRDDINFANVKDKKAINSGERVGAEDVVFTLNRAKDSKSVPEHKTFTLHESMEKIEIVTDLSELTSKKQLGGKGTVKDALEKDLKTPISKVATNKTDANNKNGSYQVVKVTTKNQFPQVLNYLAHQSAGIVSKTQVEKINTYNVATYDRNKDVAYGDQATVTDGATYNNTLAASGPYVLVYKNDYEAVFEKNPAYMPGTENNAKINKVTVKFIKDIDSALSALRSSEIQVLSGVPENKFDLVTEDNKLKLDEIKGNGVSYVIFNMAEGQKASNIDFRKAILNAVNQDEFIAIYNGKKFRAYSTLSPLVETGNVLKTDLKKSQEHAKKFNESIKK